MRAYSHIQRVGLRSCHPMVIQSLSPEPHRLRRGHFGERDYTIQRPHSGRLDHIASLFVLDRWHKLGPQPPVRITNGYQRNNCSQALVSRLVFMRRSIGAGGATGARSNAQFPKPKHRDAIPSHETKPSIRLKAGRLPKFFPVRVFRGCIFLGGTRSTTSLNHNGGNCQPLQPRAIALLGVWMERPTWPFWSATCRPL